MARRSVKRSRSAPNLAVRQALRNVARSASSAAVKYAVKSLRSNKTRVRGKYIYKYSRKHRKYKKYKRLQGSASGGTTSSTRIIVRRTPKEQKFLRRMFKGDPKVQKYVNRFGFSWLGEQSYGKIRWYSISHLKFNNVVKYMQNRILNMNTTVGSTNTYAGSVSAYGNNPSQFIYIGKCTFSYELFNPTNYIITVYIYDLICKRDTPQELDYNTVGAVDNDTPENCMYRSSRSMVDKENNPTWTVADPTFEGSGVSWNSVGMKPTDYYYFNTMWKVKGVKKIVMPPQASHHHVVVFNPKKQITQGNLFFPHEKWGANNKNGLGGLTQSTLFGFQGQIATEESAEVDNTDTVSYLPGKMIISCTKKINIWNCNPTTSETIISETSLPGSLSNPLIYSDLFVMDPDIPGSGGSKSLKTPSILSTVPLNDTPPN